MSTPLIPQPVTEHLSAIGARLKSVRKSAKISRQKLSEQSGVSARHIAQLETGGANISIGVLRHLCGALKMDWQSLVALPHQISSPANQGGPHEDLRRMIDALSSDQAAKAIALLEPLREESRNHSAGIALIGLRGAGKTTLGQKLARERNIPFVQLSKRVEELSGLTTDQIFSLGGQDLYRRLEKDAVETQIASGDACVFETTGGIVANPQTFNRVLEAFRCIWLAADPEDHMNRVIEQGDMRPMSGMNHAMDHLKALLDERRDDYARAHFHLETSGRPIDDLIENLTGWLDLSGN
ncbi:MAG: shikimate kinase [Pseudomonadota bacterium]